MAYWSRRRLPSSADPHLTYENLAVHIVSSETDVSHYHSAPAVVKVTLSGPRNVMNQLQANQVRAEVDLSSSDGSRGQVNIIRPPDVTLVAGRSTNGPGYLATKALRKCAISLINRNEHS
jgi:hypothetical protein